MPNKQYLKIYHIDDYKGWKNVKVGFVPDETIYCDPPYIKGKEDNAWIKLPQIRGKMDGLSIKQENSLYLDTTNKRQCEKLLGMKLQEID